MQGSQKAETLNPSTFFASSEGASFHANSFLDLNLSRPLLRACEALGYQKPTPIQVLFFLHVSCTSLNCRNTNKRTWQTYLNKGETILKVLLICIAVLSMNAGCLHTFSIIWSRYLWQCYNWLRKGELTHSYLFFLHFYLLLQKYDYIFLKWT
jgi:hypothetical protein